MVAGWEIHLLRSGRGGAINIWKVDARGGRLEQITVGRGDDADLDISADGRRIVFSSYRVNINLEEIPIDGGKGRKWLTSDSARAKVSPVYSHDGKHIAYFTNRRGAERESIWVMDADGANSMQLVHDERVNVHPRWSSDGQSLIYISRISEAGAGVELRRALLSGGVPQTIPFRVGDFFGDAGPQDQLVYRGATGPVEIFDSKTNQVQTLKDVQGTFFRWCPDGRRFAAVINARHRSDAAAGVWVYDLDGKRQQLFRGWAPFHAWAGPTELLILEAKPDLNGALWRVRLDGSPPVKVGSIRFIYSYWHPTPRAQFDIHPDGRRIVVEAFELHQADISLIDNVR